MIQAIIFDMDGLLIDSEPIWQEAEQRVFATVGLELTQKQTHETTGLRVDEVIEYWFTRFPWDEENISKKQLDTKIVEEVKNLIREKGESKPGAIQILKFLQSKNLPMAIASSSEYLIINCVVEKFVIADMCLNSLEKFGEEEWNNLYN